jgi:hypothetical protein
MLSFNYSSAIAAVVVVLLSIAFIIYVSRRTQFIAVLIPLASFVTRPTVNVGAFSLRLEMIVGLVCITSLLLAFVTRKRVLLPSSVWTSAFTLGAWFVVVIISTTLFAPEPVASMGTLLWCVVNVGTALWIATNPAAIRMLLRSGTFIALVSAVLAIILYILAGQISVPYGVQPDPAYGGFASYVTSIEANILGGLLCLWALVALYNPRQELSQTVRTILVLIAPIAIITTHTRAALLAYLLGVLAVLVLRPLSRNLSFAVLTFGGIGAIGLISVGQDRGLSKFLEVLDLSGGTGGLRVRVNSTALNEVVSSDSSLVGLGWNSFGQRHIDETQILLRLPGYLGNLPLQIFYDGGYIGLMLVTIAAAIVFWEVVRTKKLVILLVVAVPYLLFSISTSALWLLETWTFVGLAWFYVASSYNYDANNKQLETSKASHQSALLT